MDIDEFAKEYPIGTDVEYYPIIGIANCKATKINSYPWALGHGDIVVKVDGIAGGVSIEHIRRRDEPIIRI